MARVRFVLVPRPRDDVPSIVVFGFDLLLPITLAGITITNILLCPRHSNVRSERIIDTFRFGMDN